MFHNIKVDILYYLTNTDFEMEFNLCGCCRMRLLTNKAADQKNLIHGLARAVSRSQVIICCGTLFGETGLIQSVAGAIGKQLTVCDNRQYGIQSNDEIKIIDGSTPLVDSAGLFGGCIIESGPQTIILLTENKSIRKTIMSNLIHPYIEELSIAALKSDTEQENSNVPITPSYCAKAAPASAATGAEALNAAADAAALGSCAIRAAAEVALQHETESDTSITPVEEENVAKEVPEETTASEQEIAPETVAVDQPDAEPDAEEQIGEITGEEASHSGGSANEPTDFGTIETVEVTAQEVFENNQDKPLSQEAASPASRDNSSETSEQEEMPFITQDRMPESAPDVVAFSDITFHLEPERLRSSKRNPYATDYTQSEQNYYHDQQEYSRKKATFKQRSYNLPILILCICLLITLAVLAYLLIYLPMRDGTAFSQYIQSTFSVAIKISQRV